MFTAITNGTKTTLGTHEAVRDVIKALPSLAQEAYGGSIASQKRN